MAAPTVYQDVAEGLEGEGVGQLFSGKKFWVAQRVPSRNRFLDDIRANGGEIVLLEKNADYLIADHLRKDCPPGSISYQFVEHSLREGEMENPDDHRCGQADAVNGPPKGGRTPYTAEDDMILYKWVRDAEARGDLVRGNTIYKQLQLQHPQHPWQSWRNRYLKQLQNRPPSAFNVPDNAPPSPPSDNPAGRPQQAHNPPESEVKGFELKRKYQSMEGDGREDGVSEETHGESSQPSKRQKSASPTSITEAWEPQTELIGTQYIPVEISSSVSTSSTSLTEVMDEQSQQQIKQEMIQTLDAHNAIVDEEMENVTDSIESDDFLDIPRVSPLPGGYDPEVSADDLPSNMSTPRPARLNASNPDTQAILSSPAQAQSNPRRSLSPPGHPESDASTTQSLEEFRRSLNENDATQISHPQSHLHPRPNSLSPAPSSSSSSSNSSGDPDFPLEVDEIDEFFNEQNAEGFSNAVIVKALRRTRMRPALAVLVLDAWKEGKPLPIQRGIWSIEDDEAVESGDSVALADLKRKHTVDGWGGITERKLFLEAHRSQ